MAAGFAAGRLGRPRAPTTGPTGPGAAVVERVVDGDTIEVTLSGSRVRVRLLGIDAPESVSPSVPVQCHGVEASTALAAALAPGTVVDLERDVELRDHFDRLLLHVYRRSDGLFVNRWLVADGHAAAVSYAPNTAHRSEFRSAEREARRAGRGLWGHCDGPDQPLDPAE